VAYTLATSPGPKSLLLECAGSGRLILGQGARAPVEHEWGHGDAWATCSIPFESESPSLTVRVERATGDPPRLGMLYLLSES